MQAAANALLASSETCEQEEKQHTEMSAIIGIIYRGLASYMLCLSGAWGFLFHERRGASFAGRLATRNWPMIGLAGNRSAMAIEGPQMSVERERATKAPG